MPKIDFTKITTTHALEIDKTTIKFYKKVRGWCASKTKRFPKGCINFQKKALCPMQSKYRVDVLKKYRHFRLVYVKMDFIRYKALRKKDHETWSEGMLGNSRLWQSSLKVLLRKHVQTFRFEEMFGCGAGMLGHPSMESVGIHVFETCALNGVYLERTLEKYVHLVALLMDNFVGLEAYESQKAVFTQR